MREDVTPAMRALASLAFTRPRFDFDGDHGLIVESIDSRGKLRDCLEDFVDHAVRGFRGTAGYDRSHALLSERLAVAVAGVENAVTEEHEQIAGLGLETEFIVVGFVEEAERQAGRLDQLKFAIMIIDGPGQTRIRNQERALFIVPHGINDRHKLRRNWALGQREVDG